MPTCNWNCLDAHHFLGVSMLGFFCEASVWVAARIPPRIMVQWEMGPWIWRETLILEGRPSHFPENHHCGRKKKLKPKILPTDLCSISLTVLMSFLQDLRLLGIFRRFLDSLRGVIIQIFTKRPALDITSILQFDMFVQLLHVFYMKFIQSCYAKTRCLRHSWGLWCTCSANFYNTLCRHHAFFLHGGWDISQAGAFICLSTPVQTFIGFFQLSGKVKKHLNHPGMHRMQPQTKEIEKGFGAGSCRDGPIPFAKMWLCAACFCTFVNIYIQYVFPEFQRTLRLPKCEHKIQRPFFGCTAFLWMPGEGRYNDPCILFGSHRLRLKGRFYHPRWVALDT